MKNFDQRIPSEVMEDGVRFGEINQCAQAGEEGHRSNMRVRKAKEECNR